MLCWARAPKPICNRWRQMSRPAVSAPVIQVTDVLQFDQLQRLADVAMAQFGRIDILVNNAGGFPPKPVAQYHGQGVRVSVSL